MVIFYVKLVLGNSLDLERIVWVMIYYLEMVVGNGYFDIELICLILGEFVSKFGVEGV